MSRGPGRLQRRILQVLPAEAEARTTEVVDTLCDEWGKGSDLDDYLTFQRQVRRALDSLGRAGLVEKRIEPNPYFKRAHVSWWRLT